MEWYSLLSVVVALGVPAWLVVEELLRHRRPRAAGHGIAAHVQVVRPVPSAVPGRRAA